MRKTIATCVREQKRYDSAEKKAVDRDHPREWADFKRVAAQYGRNLFYVTMRFLEDQNFPISDEHLLDVDVQGGTVNINVMPIKLREDSEITQYVLNGAQDGVLVRSISEVYNGSRKVRESWSRDV
ncbi:MAG: hypothetical protein ACE5FT_01595 [Candidatus Nanoarchaeia archaeon]